VAVDSISKYIWNFQIYCRRKGNPQEVPFIPDSSNEDSFDEDTTMKSGKGQGLQGYYVVKHLLKDLGDKCHIVTIDNIFTSIPLFLDLLQ